MSDIYSLVLHMMAIGLVIGISFGFVFASGPMLKLVGIEYSAPSLKSIFIIFKNYRVASICAAIALCFAGYFAAMLLLDSWVRKGAIDSAFITNDLGVIGQHDLLYLRRTDCAHDLIFIRPFHVAQANEQMLACGSFMDGNIKFFKGTLTN